MREVIDALQRALDQVLSLLAHGTSDFVDATDGGNDPKLIARGGTTVGTAEAHKGLGLDRLNDRMCRIVDVLDLTREVGLHVVRVQPLAGLNVLRHVADGKTVLDDILTGCNGAHGHLVTLRDILRGNDLAHAGNLDGSTLGERRQRNDDVVGRIDLDSVHYKES